MLVIKLQGECTTATATHTNTDLVNIQYVYKKIKTNKKVEKFMQNLNFCVEALNISGQNNTQEKKMLSVLFN